MEDLIRRRARIGRVGVRVCAAPGRGGAATGESGNLCATLAEGGPQERMHVAIGFAEYVQKASLKSPVTRGPLLRLKPAPENTKAAERDARGHVASFTLRSQ